MPMRDPGDSVPARVPGHTICNVDTRQPKRGHWPKNILAYAAVTVSIHGASAKHRTDSAAFGARRQLTSGSVGIVIRHSMDKRITFIARTNAVTYLLMRSLAIPSNARNAESSWR